MRLFERFPTTVLICVVCKSWGPSLTYSRLEFVMIEEISSWLSVGKTPSLVCDLCEKIDGLEWQHAEKRVAAGEWEVKCRWLEIFKQVIIPKAHLQQWIPTNLDFSNPSNWKWGLKFWFSIHQFWQGRYFLMGLNALATTKKLISARHIGKNQWWPFNFNQR